MNPDLDAFRRLAQQGNVAPVWKALVADLETPVSAYLKLAQGRKHSFLLESVEGGERIARYTYLGADPFLKVVARGSSIEIEEDGRRVCKRVTLRRAGETRSWTERLRLYPRSEVVRMAAAAGLRIRGPDADGTRTSFRSSAVHGPQGGRGTMIVLCFEKREAA